MIKHLITLAAVFSLAVTGCRKDAEVAAVANNNDAQLEALFTGEAPKMCINKGFDTDGKTSHGVVLKNKYWSNGKEIRIKFLNGDAFLRDKVLFYASKWSQHGNITFKRVIGGSAHDLRIAFKWQGDEGSWSYLGKDAQLIEIGEPTMNFGWLDKNTDEEEFSRVIIHEIGHALGLGHEQASPVVNIKWNKNNVYWYYQRPPNNWTKEQIDYNLFYRYTTREVHYSPFDPKSIMQYPVDPRFTTNGVGIGWNTVLSSMDKIVISKVYPKK